MAPYGQKRDDGGDAGHLVNRQARQPLGHLRLDDDAPVAAHTATVSSSIRAGERCSDVSIAAVVSMTLVTMAP